LSRNLHCLCAAHESLFIAGCLAEQLPAIRIPECAKITNMIRCRVFISNVDCSLKHGYLLIRGLREWSPIGLSRYRQGEGTQWEQPDSLLVPENPATDVWDSSISDTSVCCPM